MEPSGRRSDEDKGVKRREAEISAKEVAEAIFAGLNTYSEWEAIFCKQANVFIVEYEVQKAHLKGLEVKDAVTCQEAAYIFCHNKIDTNEANWQILNSISNMADEFVFTETKDRHKAILFLKKAKEEVKREVNVEGNETGFQF